MNLDFRGAARTMPKTTLYHVTGGVGLLSTFVARLIAFILQPDLGAFIGYAAPALVIALIAWAIGGILRLRLGSGPIDLRGAI